MNSKFVVINFFNVNDPKNCDVFKEWYLRGIKNILIKIKVKGYIFNVEKLSVQ